MGGDVIILEIRQPNCMPFRRTCEGLRQRLHIQIEYSTYFDAKRLLGCFHQQPFVRILELALFGSIQSIAVESFDFCYCLPDSSTTLRMYAHANEDSIRRVGQTVRELFGDFCLAKTPSVPKLTHSQIIRGALYRGCRKARRPSLLWGSSRRFHNC